MESNPNNSRIGVELGAPLDGNEKSTIKVALNFGRGAADLQTEKLKSIIGAEDPNLSLVFVLPPLPGKHQELEDVIREYIEGKYDNPGPKKLRGLVESGMITVRYFPSGSNVVLILQPGPLIEPIVKAQIERFLSMGIQDLADSEQAAINLNFASAIDGYDLLEYHNKKYSSLAALWTSSMFELTLKTVEGSKLDTKLLDLLKSMLPFLSGSPLPLLQFVKAVDVDFSFRDIEELPASLKEYFATGDSKDAIQGPRIPQGLKTHPVGKLLERISDTLKSDVEVYLTLDKVAAINLSLKVPGFGDMLLTPHEYMV